MKRAIVLSGGGVRGAFQVGALDYLLNEVRLDYHIVSGTSVGALNASAIAQKDFEILKQVWLLLKQESDFFHKKPFGILGGLLGASSIYTNRSLEKIINKHIDRKKLEASGIELRVSVVNLQTGQLETANQRNRNIKKYILASTAMPALFEPVIIGKYQYIDGGIRDVTPLSAAIDAGANEIIAILSVNHREISCSDQFSDFRKILERGIDIMIHEILMNDIQIAERVNEKTRIFKKIRFGLPKEDTVFFQKHRHVEIKLIEPEKGELDFGMLEVDPVKIRKAIKHGYVQAQKLFPK